MLHHDSLKKTDEMRAILDQLARNLVLTDTENGEGLVALPQVYPGGDAVVVRIQKHDDQFVVTDQGAGYQAAEHLGGTGTFSRLAPAIAHRNGIEFDGHMMFAARVSLEWLANTVIFVGSASRMAVEMTAQRMSEDKEISLRQNLQDKIGEVFRARAAFDISLPGRSSRVRNFAALVDGSHGRVLFDLVTPHHVSINGAIVKFQDVAQLEDSPMRTAVLSSENRTDPADVGLLSQWTTSVIKLDSDLSVFRKAA